MQDVPGSHGERISWTAFLSHLRRAARSDLTSRVATDAERATLAGADRGRPAVHGTHAQDYLAWRRSLLWTATAALAASAVIALVTFLIDVFEDTTELEKFFNIGVLKFLSFVQLLATLWLPIAGWQAIRRWDDLRASHLRVRRGWLVGFLVPFALALVPMKALFLFEPPTTLEEAQGQAGLLQIFGIMFGLVLFLHLVPSVLAVFVGAIRSALAVKQMLPESALPGWIATVAAPVFALVALSVFVLFHQIGGNWLFLIGFALVVVNYLLLTRDGPRLARPHKGPEVRGILAPIRRRGAVLVSAGSVCLLMNPLQLVELVIAVVGRSLFTMVLFSDLMTAMLRHAWRETQTLQVSELGNVLEEKIREMEEAGVGNLRKAPAPAAATPA
jgi:hypothetical protein